MHLTVTSLQCQCLSLLMIDQGNVRKPEPTKLPKPNIKETPIERGNPSDDSEIPEWLQEFRENLVDDEKFHYREALTPVLLMKFVWSRLQRDVRIWVNTIFTLTPLKTEIARSVSGPKLQGPHAEDAMAKPYLVL